MYNYSPNTQAFASDVLNGICVETGSLANTAYLIQTQKTIFHVYGRVKVNLLYMEVLTDCSAHATVLKFRFASTTPVIAVADMSANSGAITSAIPGTRVTCLGGAVATGTSLDAGISPATTPMIIGTCKSAAGVQGVGIITCTSATASQASGTVKFVCYYVPLEDGAYVESV
jgi:hypothetical protein